MKIVFYFIFFYFLFFAAIKQKSLNYSKEIKQFHTHIITSFGFVKKKNKMFNIFKYDSLNMNEKLKKQKIVNYETKKLTINY